MRTIGLLGGMSWESTALYYRWINEQTREQRGRLHSAPIVLYSVDFEQIEQLQHAGDWQQAGKVLAEAGQALERAGADFVLICTNTMHKVAPAIAEAINVPLLHLADATGKRIVADGYQRVGLLGTRFTMQEDFYRRRLEQHGLDVVVPAAADQEVVHNIIYTELCRGLIRDESRQRFLDVINRLQDQQGAEAVIEGCTEIVMLVQQEHTQLPLYDTTAIHASEAVRMALQDA